jgi:hypothetical protein
LLPLVDPALIEFLFPKAITTTMDDEIIETDLLIVGAGPAGAALACFLASYGTLLAFPQLFYAHLRETQGEPVL